MCFSTTVIVFYQYFARVCLFRDLINKTGILMSPLICVDLLSFCCIPTNKWFCYWRTLISVTNHVC